MDWYGTTYRKLFFDFHSQETVKGLASAFDAERWAERLAEANVQAVSVFTRCGFGWSFYRKGTIRYVHPQLPAGLDLLEAQITALHRRNIKAIGYYATPGSEPVAKEYPDWVQKDAAGKPVGTTICTHGPFLEKVLLPHVEEIVRLYEVDGMFFDGTFIPDNICYCTTCRNRFEKETGLVLPKTKDDASWPAYVKWRLKDYQRIRKAIADAIHRINPEVAVSFNWAYTMRMPEIVPGCIDNLMLDIEPTDQMFNGSYQARHWASGTVPFDIMNTAFIQWWGDWCCKPARALQHEVATIIANGGLTWIGYHMTHAFDVHPVVLDQMGQALGFVKDREGLLAGARPWAGVAVLRSTDSYYFDQPRGYPDEKSLRGVHKVMLESALPHHFVNEQWLLTHLQGVPAAERYPVVVLSDQRRIEDDLAKALEQYVREGGGLLVTGRTGTLDQDFKPTGKFVLENLLGVKLTGQDEQTHCFFDVTDKSLDTEVLPMPHLVESPGILVQPTANDVQVLADLWKIYLRGDGQFLLQWSPPGSPTGHPAVTFRRVGRGAVAYVAADIFRAYHVKNVWPLKHILAALVRKLAPNFPVHVAAPAWVEVALADQKTPTGIRTLVHLVNHHGNRPVDANNVCIEQTLPVRDIVVTLRRSARPAKVTQEPEGIRPEWYFDGQHLIVRIPELQIHTAIVVE